ncbi:glycosyltransferase [Paenibacillus chibensis]|uniref:glycosyltransferase n=1 Tax=Paenibacillus chibensis TaxID=59846 RepID=UPI001FE86CD7|nr:glycosyltransferase [Paenibacillus chibensis]MEC0372468.1 glycosyltransferase [Paenibacillus chibensis]
MTGKKVKTGTSARTRRRRVGRARKQAVFKTKRRASAIQGGSGSPWIRQALQAGWRAGNAARDAEAETKLLFVESHLQSTFSEWIYATMKSMPEYSLMKRMSAAYVQGYNEGAGSIEGGVPLPLQGSAAAVVCASSEEDSLDPMLAELERLPLKHIILVLNGSRDNSYSHARSHPLVTAVYYPELLGHDVGRSIGARLTDADTVLFCDGDMVIAAEELAPFIYAVDGGGCDAALNDLSGYLPLFEHQDEVTHCKSYLNLALGRSDLGASSLTAVPHALSGRMIRDIGASQLTVPPKAQALAILHGYRVEAVHAVDVFKGNRKRAGNTGKRNAVAELIIGDHAEALGELWRQRYAFRSDTGAKRKEVASRRNAV